MNGLPWEHPKVLFADENLPQVRRKVDQSFQTELGATCSSFHWGLLSSHLPSSTRLRVGKDLCQVPVVKMNGGLPSLPCVSRETDMSRDD